MSDQHQQLTAAATAFEEWRNSRVHTREKTPEALQQQVAALLPHYATSTIKKALKISGSNMKRWSQQPQATSAEGEFVTLPFDDEPVHTAQPDFNLELTFNNGCRLRLQGDISPAQLSALAQSVYSPTEMPL